MKKILLILALFSVVLAGAYFLSVGVKEKPVYSVELESAIGEWKRYQQEAGVFDEAKFNEIRKITVGPLPRSKAGLSDINAKTITISPATIEKGKYSVRACVWHELGHYMYGLDHGSCLMMADSLFPEEITAEYWGHMKSEYMELVTRSYE